MSPRSTRALRRVMAAVVALACASLGVAGARQAALAANPSDLPSIGPGDPSAAPPTPLPTPTRTTVDPYITDDTRPSVIVDSVNAPVNAVRIVKGRSLALPVVVYSSFPTDSELMTWRASNTHIAVSPTMPVMRGRLDGSFRAPLNNSAVVRITGRSLGAATLTVVAPGGAKIAVKVVVVAKTVKASSLTIAHTRKHLRPGQVANLTARARPRTATGVVVRWTSSKPSVATVDDGGRLVAQATGRTVVTAHAGSKKAKLTVTVR